MSIILLFSRENTTSFFEGRRVFVDKKLEEGEEGENQIKNNNLLRDKKEKEKKKEEQEAILMGGEREKVKNILLGVKKGTEADIKKYHTIKNKYSSLINDIFRTDDEINKKDQAEIQKNLVADKKQYKKHIEDIKYHLKSSSNPFQAHHLKVIAKVPFIELLKSFDSENQQQKFLHLFRGIDSSNLSENTKAIYESLAFEIGLLMEDEDIPNNIKVGIFQKYIQWKCLDTGDTFEDNQYKVAKKVIEQENITNKAVRDAFINNASKQIHDISGLESSLYTEDESNNQEVREQKMVDKVASVLGNDIANKAQHAMEQHSIENEQSRMKAFFETVQTSSWQNLKLVENIGINQVSKYVKETEKVCSFIIDDFPGLSSNIKSEKQNNLKTGFAVYYDYLKALNTYHKKNDSLPLIQFFYNGGENEVTKESFRKLNIFSKQEAYMAFSFEKERKILQKKIVKERKKYEDYKEKVNGILENTNFEDKSKGLNDLGILTSEGITQMSDGEEFKPWYFSSLKSIQNEYNFTDQQLSKTLLYPLESSLPREVISTIMTSKKITKTGIIPENIYRFFEKNRLTQGLETITEQVSMIPQNILEFGDEAGWIKEGENQEAKDEYSSFANKEEMESFLDTQKNTVIGIIKKITPYAEGNDEYSHYIQSTVHSLENSLSHIPVDIEEEDWNRNLASFSTAITNLHKKDGKESLVSTIGGIKDFKRIIPESINGLDETITSIVNSHQSSSDNPTKALYDFFTTSIFNKDRQQPSLDELSWTLQMPLFGLWKEGNGISKEGVEEVQKLMTKKNEYNEYCIQSRSMFNESGYLIEDAEMGTHGDLKVYYYHDKRVIILDDKFYNPLKFFNSEADNLESVEVPLSFIFHESTHSMVEKDPHLLTVFEKLLKNTCPNEGMDSFESIKTRVEQIFEKNNGSASAMEELLANVGAMLQFDEDKRNEILNYDETVGHYGMGRSLRGEVKKVFDILGEKKIQELFGHAFERSKKHKERVNNNALSTADEGKEIDGYENMFQNSPVEKDPEVKTNKNVDRTSVIKSGLASFDSLNQTFEDLLKQLDNAVTNLPSGEREQYPGWKQAREHDMNKYRNKILFDIDSPDDIEGIEDDIKNDVIGKVQSKINETAYLNQYPQGGLSHMWQNTTLLSLSDVGKIFTTTWEYIKRRHESKQKRRVGKVGHDMFDGVIDGLANEFQKEEANAQNAEVEEIQGGLKNGSDADVIAYLDQVSNEDELKAVLQEQASRGLIQWDQKDKNGRIYPRILRHLGSSVRFYDSDFDPNNLSLLNTKFHKAFLQIYGDESLFNTIFQQNKDKITSRRKEGVETANQRGGHIPQLQEWLRMANRGEHVPFHEYEGYISFFVGDGTDDPWQFLYYLLMGIEEGAIPYDALLRFWGDHSNDFPPIDGVHQMSLEKIQDMKKQILPESGGRDSWDGMPKEFLLWVHANMMTNTRTVERTYINSVQTMPYDHDCAHLLTSVGNADGAVKMLAQGSTGNSRFKPTVYNQAVLGMMTNLASISLYNEKGGIDPEIAKETIRRQAGYFGAFDIVSNNRAYTAKKSLFTFKTTTLDRKPRGAGSYNGEMDTENYFEMGRAIYSNVSHPELRNLCQRFIFDTSLKGDNGAGLIKRWNEEIATDSVTYPSLTKILGSPLPNLKADNLENNVAEIIDAVFTYFLRDSPSADKNIAEITKNSVDVANGRGIAGVEGSEKWAFTAMEPEKGEIMPDSYTKFE